MFDVSGADNRSTDFPVRRQKRIQSALRKFQRRIAVGSMTGLFGYVCWL